MQDTGAPGFQHFLAEENQRFDAVMAPAMLIAKQIHREIVDRFPRHDMTVPYRFGGYEYHYSFFEDREYPCYLRRRVGSGEEPELLLDFNTHAVDGQFLDVQTCVDHLSTVMAFAVDTKGNLIYEIQFRDLVSGRDLPYRIPLATGNMAWTADGKTLFYSELDPATLRWHRIKRYVLGSDPSLAETVYEESDDAFSCVVYPAKSQQMIFIRSSSGDEDELLFVDADAPFAAFRVVQARRAGVEYDVQHDGSSFVIRTNLGAPGFRVVTAPVQAPGSENWVELGRPADGAFLADFEVFSNHVALKERKDGTVRVRIVQRTSRLETVLTLPAATAHAVEFRDNLEINAATLRYEYSSLVSPTATYDYHLETGETVLLKKEVVGGGFDERAYGSERRLVSQGNGVAVPLTLLYRKGRELVAGPALLSGYGAYGISVDPAFWPPYFSLVDRGFVVAIAHVRGGGESGRPWHDAGRRLRKPNSISDFLACAEYLHETGIAHRQGLFAMGESAGGLLVGAAINQRPDLFRAVVAIAPFVDVLHALSDPRIPLTTTDYSEWGNPADPDDYRCIRSYSPYDNVRQQEYPDLLVLSGVNDTQVPVWQPAKWVARMRDLRTRENILLLKTELEAGHLGPSGRYAHHWEPALVYAFLVGVWEDVLKPDPVTER